MLGTALMLQIPLLAWRNVKQAFGPPARSAAMMAYDGLGAVLFGGTGCGDDADGAEGPGPTAGQSGGTPCVAGTSYSCFGAGACAGTRLCRDGFLTSCICQGPGPAADASAADAARPADAATPDASAPDAAAQAGSGGARAGSGGGPAPVSEDCSNGTDDDGAATQARARRTMR